MPMRVLLSFVLISLQLYSPKTTALEVQLNQNLSIRSPGRLRHDVAWSERKKTGLLKAGSTVEVPDQFAVFNQEGNIDLQQTLISWLANDEQTAITGFTRKNRVEFFFPVKVIEATNGSKCPLGEEGCFNKEILIALHFLARKETKPNRPQFLTVVDAPFVVKDKNEDKGEDEKSNFCPSSQNNALAYLIGEETTALLASINVMTHLTQDAEDQGRKVLNFLKKNFKKFK